MDDKPFRLYVWGHMLLIQVFQKLFEDHRICQYPCCLIIILKNKFFFFWLHWVLVVACRVFVEACRIFCCSMSSLLWHTGFSLVVACGFSLSSCGMWAPGHVGSVVVVGKVQSAGALEFAACRLSR